MPKTMKHLSIEQAGGQYENRDMYHVSNKHDNDHLGIIHWHRSWKKFVFRPGNNTVFEHICLQDIADFCAQLTQKDVQRRAPSIKPKR